MPDTPGQTRLPTRARLALRAAAASVCLLAMSVATAAAPYAGRTLDDVLRELAGRGLQLIYNEELVPPRLRVTREPRAGSDEAVLEQVLAEHGLQARKVGTQIFAVVRMPAPTTDCSTASLA